MSWKYCGGPGLSASPSRSSLIYHVPSLDGGYLKRPMSNVTKIKHEDDAIYVKVDFFSGRLNEVAAVPSVQLVVSAYAAVTTLT